MGNVVIRASALAAVLVSAACSSTERDAPPGGGGAREGIGGSTAGGASAGGRAGAPGGRAGGGAPSGGTASGGTTTGGGGAGGVATGGAGGVANGGVGGVASGGAGGAATGGAGGAVTGGAGGAVTGGAGGAATGGASSGCETDCTQQGLVCCDGACVNTGNDILNCGGCDIACAGDDPYCDHGTCGTPPCSGTVCTSTTCCGSSCCAAGQLCCEVNVGPTTLGCQDPVDGTCPVGCPFCVCASADTLVDTPDGPVPIHAVRVGDVVYGPEGDAVVPTLVLQTNRAAAENHVMVEVRVEGGATIRMSPRHPTVDGRAFRDLGIGDTLGDARIIGIDVTPYPHAFTYDLLTATESGGYFAEGVLVGSTLRR